MYRAVFKIFVSLALALGLTTAFAGTTTAANAAPAVTSGVNTAAAPDCSAEQQSLSDARAKRAVTKQKLRKARVAKRKAVRALKRARANHNRDRVVLLKKRIKRLKARIARLERRLNNQRQAVRAAKADHEACLAGGTASPVQALCDAGVPQEVCDALAGLAGGTPEGLSLDALCAAVPETQPLCDAIGGGSLPSDPSELTGLLEPILDTLGLGDLLGGGLPPVQALCDAGVPQAICDALAAEAGGVPSDLSLDALCTAVPETQPICDASAGGVPTDPAVLAALLEPVLVALGLDALVDDLLGGLLGGGLPLPRTA